MNEPACEMPKYKCHKEVWALKIAGILYENDAAFIIPEDKRYAKFAVDSVYMRKHNPIVGGYYVVYDDGYKSFSPASAFEAGYRKI